MWVSVPRVMGAMARVGVSGQGCAGLRGARVSCRSCLCSGGGESRGRGYSGERGGHEGDINEVISRRARALNADYFAKDNQEKLDKLRKEYLRRRASEVEHTHTEAVEALRALLDKHGVAHTGILEGALMEWKETHF